MNNSEINRISNIANVFIDKNKSSQKVVFNNNVFPETQGDILEKIEKAKKHQYEKGLLSNEFIVETQEGKFYSSIKGYV